MRGSRVLVVVLTLAGMVYGAYPFVTLYGIQYAMRDGDTPTLFSMNPPVTLTQVIYQHLVPLSFEGSRVIRWIASSRRKKLSEWRETVDIR